MSLSVHKIVTYLLEDFILYYPILPFLIHIHRTYVEKWFCSVGELLRNVITVQ